MLENVWKSVKENYIKNWLRIKYIKKYCSGQATKELNINLPDNPLKGIPILMLPIFLIAFYLLVFPVFFSWIWRKY